MTRPDPAARLYGPALVRLDARARREWPWLPPAAAPGTWWRSDAGDLVRVLDGGAAELLAGPLPHTRALAADPCAGAPARRRRYP